jgi:branched-chain amino acid transport system permease protein
VPLLAVDGPFGLNIIPQLWVGVLVRIAIFAIAVQGLNILMGYTGQISLGHAAFMAVGAYSGAIFAREFGMPFWIAVPSAAIFTGFVGLLFGLPSLRVKGFYLAMATLAAQFIIPWVMRYPLEHLTNGSRPLEVPTPTIFGISFSHESAMFYLVIPSAVLLFLGARNMMRTRIGRAFISVRDNDLAAELLGINVFTYKLRAFFLSSVYAGLAGALWAFDSGSLSLDKFTLVLSVEMLAMLVIGGAGWSLGPLFGVAFITLLTQTVIPSIIPPLYDVLPSMMPFVDPVNIFAALSPLLFGLALITFLIIEPRGLAYRWEILKIAWKIRPYSY